MRRPVRNKSTARGPVSKVFPWTSPTQGWFDNDNIDMPEDGAYQLDNWFPDTNAATVRPGYGFFARAKAFDTPVGTLMAYQSGMSTELFVCVDSEILAIVQEDRLPFVDGVMTAIGSAYVDFENPDGPLSSGAYGEFAVGETE